MCGKNALTKLVSAAGFQLKGSGWYQTDFRGSGAKPAPKSGAAKTDADSGPTVADKGTPGKDASGTDRTKSTETKPSTPAAPATSSGSTPAAGA